MGDFMNIDAIRLESYLSEKEKIINQIDKICNSIDFVNKKIFLFNIPSDSNLGDHAQTLCIKQLLHIKYPKYQIITFPTFRTLSYSDLEAALYRLKPLVYEEDIIVFHSGYHINDIYFNSFCDLSPTTMVQLIILSFFNKNKIIFFPQTINMNEEHMKSYKKVIEKCNNIILMCRDQVSFRNANQYWRLNKIYLVPDIVTTLIGRWNIRKPRDTQKTVCIALRNRKTTESLITDEQIDIIKRVLIEKGYTIKTSTTISEASSEMISENAEIFVKDKIKEFASYSFVITDLYHGTIFSIIANTPVFVLKSSDHKVKSGLDFFRQYKEFDNRFFYDDEFDNLLDIIKNYDTKNSEKECVATPFFYLIYNKLMDEI